MTDPIFASVEAEQSTLGGLMLDQSKLPDVQDILTGEEFFASKNREIYRAIVEVAEANQPVDPITVAERIQAAGREPDLKYLTELTVHTPSAANVTTYANMVAEFAVKRQIAMSAMEIQRYLQNNPGITSAEAIEMAQARIIELSDHRRVIAEAVPMREALRNYVDHLDQLFQAGDQINGLPTGLADIDARLNGLKPENLIVVAGRPSMGKSSLALQVALNLSVRHGKRGLFFSLEMSEAELMEKAVANVGRIPLDWLQKPATAPQDLWPKIAAAVSQCKDSRFGVVDCPGIHINQLKSYARRAHRREPLDYIVVDHINLMTGDGQNRTLELGSISGGLKTLAKELRIPVIALAQLNRSVEERPNKRPRMSDLRDSGTVEQDADIIQLLYRDDYYNEDSADAGIVEINTGKFRNGKVGTDKVVNALHLSRFENLSPEFWANRPKPIPKPSTRSKREQLQ